MYCPVFEARVNRGVTHESRVTPGLKKQRLRNLLPQIYPSFQKLGIRLLDQRCMSYELPRHIHDYLLSARSDAERYVCTPFC